MAKVNVIGLGYMGLPMAALLARAGHEVLGVDINPSVVDEVNAGHCPLSEPGMTEHVREAVESGKLTAASTPERAEFFILSLPTPVDHESHAPDMRAVESGTASIAPVLQAGNVVILESTSPVGATQTHVQGVIERLRPDLVGQVGYVFCPERAIPGNTLHEMATNDRVVGGEDADAVARAVNLYKSICTGALSMTSTRIAEMVKLVENASRDAQLAFANELSVVCQRLGLDVREVIALANRHPRVNILQPSSGVGGHCIAVDPWFIISQAPEDTPLMQTVRLVNDAKPHWVAAKVREAADKVREEQGLAANATVRVACLGLSYKPDVDDLRESPSLTVVHDLMRDHNLSAMVVEPHLDESHAPVGLELTHVSAAIAKAEVVVTLTAHSLFRELPEGVLQGKKVVDSCGVFRGRNDVADAGL